MMDPTLEALLGNQTSQFNIQKELLKKVQGYLKRRWRTKLIATSLLMQRRNWQSNPTYNGALEEKYDPTLDVYPKHITCNYTVERVGYIKIDDENIMLISGDYTHVTVSYLEIPLADPNCYAKAAQAATRIWQPEWWKSDTPQTLIEQLMQ